MPLTRLAAQLDPVLDRAIHATGGDLGNIQVLDRSADALRILVQRGFQQPFLDFFDAVHGGDAGCGTALSTRRRTVVSDVRFSPLYTPEARDAMLAAGAHACQSTPIALDGEIVGIISTHFRAAHVPSPRELRRIDLLAREAADIICREGIVDDAETHARSIRDEAHEASDKTRIIRRR